MRQVPARPGDRMNAPAPFDTFRRELDRLFDNFGMTSLRAAPWMQEGALAPSIDYAESEKDVTVSVELPGVDENDIEVTLHNEVLVIRGEKKHERDETKDNVRLSERVYGMFERRVGVPEGIDPSKVVAAFEKGVLRVTLPKPTDRQAGARRIAIGTGSQQS